MEMAKKMDEENARRMKSELTDRTGDLDNIEEKPDSEEVNPKKAFGKGVTDQTTSGKVMPALISVIHLVEHQNQEFQEVKVILL